MQNKNIIIWILSGIILIGGLYIYLLPKNNVLTDVNLLPIQQYGLGTETATTAPPYVAPEPDEPVASTTTQIGKIDEHLTINPTLREVNFCGNTYKVKQVMIDGVDVVQRIAELMPKKEISDESEIDNFGTKDEDARQIECLNLKMNIVDSKIIRVGEVGRYTDGTEISDDDVYSIPIMLSIFSVILSTGDIYIVSGYDGSYIESIGKLK
ncbi:MAG: hypothetical protein RLZZ230_674 [Candidatus Parcubacteria bacterium]|jgi:hypothetical protein